MCYRRLNFSLTTTAFFTEFKDIIVSDARVVENCLWAGRPAGQARCKLNCMTVGRFDNQQNFGFKGNADKAESYGVELSAKYDISPNFDVKANYTWLQSEITEGENQGNPIENTPRGRSKFCVSKFD